MRAWTAAAALLLAGTGCVLDDLDHEGRPCPCIEGWTCQGGTCVREGVPDAATPDAPTPDVPARDGGAIPCPSGALFCDGFEDGDRFYDPTMGPWHATVAPDGATLVTTTDQRRSGSYALFARTVSAGGQAAAVAQSLGNVSDGTLYARAWLYVPSGQEMDGVIALSLGDGLSGFVHALIGPGDQLALVVGAFGDFETFPAGGSTTYPVDEWFCLRLRVAVADAGSAALHLGDGPAVVTSRSGVDTLPPGAYESVIVGVGFSVPAQRALGLYVDDVVVDTAEVGCM